MYLHQLYVFYHVAKYKSFSKAGDVLCITQPSVSIQIKILEDAYGTKLFERSGKAKITMTDAGNILYSYLEKSFNLIKEAESIIEDMKGMKYGRINISAIPTLASYYLPSIIERFRNAYPDIEIQLMGDFQENVIENILSLKADLGFVGRPVVRENVLMKKLWDEELVVIVPPAHPFAALEEIPLDQLREQRFIICEKGSGTREVIDQLTAGKDIRLRYVMEIGDNEALKSSVASGLGISIISNNVARRDVQQGRLKALRLKKERLHRAFYAIHHKNKFVTSAMRKFLDAATCFPVQQWRDD